MSTLPLSTFLHLFDPDRGYGRVVIPRIQRDYAQGRAGEKAHGVRRSIVSSLLGAIRTREPLHLDFVYGEVAPGKDGRSADLRVIDGQQRLTTLFLLHWYLACLDGRHAELRAALIDPDGESRFAYQTRPSSSAFFRLLVQHGRPQDHAGEPSSWVRDRYGYAGMGRDPTVQGALAMVDEIHRQCPDGASGAWAALADPGAPAVTFSVFNLGAQGLDEDVYLKMNGRGLPLTRFDVFKNALDALLERPEVLPDVARRFRTRMDTDWAQWVWTLGDAHDPGEGHQSPGDLLSWHMLAMLRALAYVSTFDTDADALGPEDRARVRPPVGRHESADLRWVLSPRDLVVFLPEFLEVASRVLDTLQQGWAGCEGGPPPSGSPLVDSPFFQEREEIRLFLRGRGQNYDIGRWLRWLGYLLFIERFGDELLSPDDAVRANARVDFREWTRLVHNLSERGVAAEQLDREVGRLRGLLLAVPDIGAAPPERLLRFIGSDAFVAFFPQVPAAREEHRKAALLLADPHRSDQRGWRAAIEAAELHPRHVGDIRFLLDWAGVPEWDAADAPAGWSAERHAELRERFVSWEAASRIVFPVQPTPLGDPEAFLLERAVLTFGDVLLRAGRETRVVPDRQGDHAWRRLVDHSADPHRAEVLRSFIDAFRQSPHQADPAEFAAGRITEWCASAASAEAEPWRRVLIQDPAALAYCAGRRSRGRARRCLAWLGESRIALLQTTQVDDAQFDLLLFALLTRLGVDAQESRCFGGRRWERARATFEGERQVQVVSTHGALDLDVPGEDVPSVEAPWVRAEGGWACAGRSVEEAEGIIRALARRIQLI